MKLIMPVAGASTRFAGMKPKWLLTHPDGNLMFFKALEGLNLDVVDEVVFICRDDHREQYRVDYIIERQLVAGGFPLSWRLIAVPPTVSQPETVARGIRAGGIEGPIFVKDSDNHFKGDVRPGNIVSTMDLNRLTYIDAANKSYVELDAEERVTNIVEKRVISNTFCVGGYGFADARLFVEYFDRLVNDGALYVSHVIYEMLMDGHTFHSMPVDDFLDWGTLREWNRYKRQYGAIFLDLDGTVVENSGEFFEPYWGTTAAIAENVAAVNALFDSGKVRIIVTTSRKSSYEEQTRAQLARIGLRYHDIIFGVPHAKRVVVNDFSRTNPYQSAEAINLPRNAAILDQMLSDLFEH